MVGYFVRCDSSAVSPTMAGRPNSNRPAKTSRPLTTLATEETNVETRRLWRFDNSAVSLDPNGSVKVVDFQGKCITDCSGRGGGS